MLLFYAYLRVMKDVFRSINSNSEETSAGQNVHQTGDIASINACHWVWSWHGRCCLWRLVIAFWAPLQKNNKYITKKR